MFSSSSSRFVSLAKRNCRQRLTSPPHHTTSKVVSTFHVSRNCAAVCGGRYRANGETLHADRFFSPPVRRPYTPTVLRDDHGRCQWPRGGKSEDERRLFLHRSLRPEGSIFNRRYRFLSPPARGGRDCQPAGACARAADSNACGLPPQGAGGSLLLVGRDPCSRQKTLFQTRPA